MEYCLYNAIKTPDGTILHCEDSHDYKCYIDKVSKEEYVNDGTGYSIRRSVNKVPYEDLSITDADPFEKIRTAKFWGSFGKDGKSKKVIMALEEMEDSHLTAILETQKRLEGTVLQGLFLKEIEYRVQVFKDKLSDALPSENKVEKKKKKV